MGVYGRINSALGERSPQFFRFNLVRPRYPIFIAEVGSNHCGDLDRAKRFIEIAKEVGASAVKFQLFKREDIARKPDLLAPETELPAEWIPELSAYAHSHDLGFLCTPFALWAIPVLAPYVDGWKISSYESLYTDLLFALPKDRKPLFYSTGMTWDRNLTRMAPFIISPGCIFMHCVPIYPTPYRQAGLIRLKQFKNRRWRCGYSSHTEGFADVVAASAFNLVAVEKHIQMDDQPASPDSGPWALKPAAFKTMIQETHNAIDARLSVFSRPDPAPGRRLFGA